MNSNMEKKYLPEEQHSGKSSINSKLPLEPETHLQSLGFSMQNGKARFILGDDTPSYSHAALTNFSVVDTDDTASFVVLGRDSLDSIQASSLASYVDIQQKGMSVDYNSMIASLDSAEVYQKLNELLQENGKLKETLKQNNIAMKQQFNTLASWQEEIMKVHQNHKKKFAETRELINYLKKENTELKMKLSSENSDDTKIGYEEPLSTSKKEEDSSSTINELQERVSSLTDELNSSKLKCDKLSTDLETILNISNLMASYMNQATSTIQEQRLNMKKLDIQSAMSVSDNTNYFNPSLNYSASLNAESLKKCTECEECRLKDKEMNSLKESIVMLEHKLQDATAPVQFCIKNLINPKKYRQQHISKIQQYNEKLQELMACFDKQVAHCTSIEEYLKELLRIWEANETLNKSGIKVDEPDYSWLLSESIDLQNKSKDQLSSCYRKLIEERQKFIICKKHTVLVQCQFHKALLDCNSIVHELETMLGEKAEENSKTSTVSESVQKTTEKESNEGKGLLEEEKILLTKEKEKLEEEKKLLSSQQQSLETEYKNLNDAKELLHQERISLHEEKSSLDQQSQLYESHYKKTLDAEKEKYEAKYSQLITEIGTLHECIQTKEFTIKVLQKQIDSHLENVKLLQTQLNVYEEDFKQEKKIKESLLDEKGKLNTDLQKQIDFNEKLQQEIGRLKSKVDIARTSCDHDAETTLVPPLLSTYLCPVCESTFSNMQHLQEHVERCLNI
ncbi:uncharacterized protein LOC143184109 [Calliopsis andreniformis]|uniref:uncharacterized protein LOC143184109 n=1 Tax=Calliopsis andreniformis TaxID=337506 RepID=UPI003FCC4204